MAVTLYSYDKLCDSARLSKEIKETASIIVGEDHIETISSPATTKVYMKDVLPQAEEDALDALVAAHVATPLPDTSKLVKLDSPTESDGTPIIRHRLPLPIYKIEPVRAAGGGRNLNVNGSVTPRDFDFAPSNAETWDVEKILFGIDDAGLSDFLLFGGITSLGNGILVQVKVGGVTYDLATLKDNADIAMVFPKGNFVVASGVLDTADGYYGSLELSSPLRLKAANSDHIRFTVRDNLTGINLLRAGVVARRVLGNE